MVVSSELNLIKKKKIENQNIRIEQVAFFFFSFNQENQIL